MDVDIAQLERHSSRRGRAPSPIPPSLTELTRRLGPVVPVVVRRLEGRRFEILANEHAWLAAQACGYHRVPIELVEVADESAALEILRATDERPDPLAVVRHYARLVTEERRIRRWGATARVARQCGVGRDAVDKAVRLLQLPESILYAVEVGALTLGHMYALLSEKSPERRFALADRALREKLSVRSLEQVVRARASGSEKGRGLSDTVIETAARSPDVLRLERRLTEYLGSPVTLDETGGTLTIDYRRSFDVLESVCERIGLPDEEGW